MVDCVVLFVLLLCCGFIAWWCCYFGYFDFILMVACGWGELVCCCEFKLRVLVWFVFTMVWVY